MTKRIFTSAILILVLLVGILAVSSCNRGHKEHSYVASQVGATCTEVGKVVYTCSCGDSYEEPGQTALGHDYVDRKGNPATCTAEGYEDYQECARCGHSTKTVDKATGHYYLIDSIEYPTATEKGSKKLICEVCGDKKTEVINAVSFAFPTGSEIIAAIIGELQFYAKTDANTYFTTGTVTSDDATDNHKEFYYVNLGEVSLSASNGVPQGYLKLELLSDEVSFGDGYAYGDVTAVEYNRLGEIYLYLNGDVVSIEVKSPNSDPEKNEINITEVLYTALFNMLGINVEDMDGAAYVFGELANVVDDLYYIVEGVYGSIPTVSEKYLEDLALLLAATGEDLVDVTGNSDGSKTYKVDFNALGRLIEALEGKTVYQIIDHMYGTGSSDSLKNFLISLPEMKLKDVANFVITIAEQKGADVNAIYSAIDLFIYYSTGSSVNIRYQVESNYKLTLAELLGHDFEDVAELKQQITDALYEIWHYDVNELYNAIAFDDPDYAVNGEKFEILTQLKGVCAQLNSVTGLEVTLYESGMLKSLDVFFGDIKLSLEYDGLTLVAEIDYMDVSIDATVTPDRFDLYIGTVTDTYVKFNAQHAEYYGLHSGGVDLWVGGNDLIDLYFEYTEGEFTRFDAEIRQVVYIPGTSVEEGSNETPVEPTTKIEAILTVNLEHTDDLNSWTITSHDITAVLDIENLGGKGRQIDYYLYKNDEAVVNGYLRYLKTTSTGGDKYEVRFSLSDGEFELLNYYLDVIGNEVSCFVTVNEISLENGPVEDADGNISYEPIAGTEHISSSVRLEFSKKTDVASLMYTYDSEYDEEDEYMYLLLEEKDAGYHIYTYAPQIFNGRYYDDETGVETFYYFGLSGGIYFEIK